MSNVKCEKLRARPLFIGLSDQFLLMSKKLPVVMTESRGRGWGRGLYSGPKPIQLVVVMAVRAAVSAAITIFSAISMNLFFSFIFFLGVKE